MSDVRLRVVLSGVPASPGYAIGPMRILRPAEMKIEERIVPDDRIAYELVHFEKAVVKSGKEIRIVRNQVAETLGEEEARIFDTHLMILQDPALVEAVPDCIRTRKVNAESAVQQVSSQLIQFFERQGTQVSREKAHDIRDIVERILGHLSDNGMDFRVPELETESILVAHTLSPSAVGGLETGQLLGFATDTGGATSHVAIIARSMQIPAVCGLNQVTLQAHDGDIIVVDGHEGLVILNPNEEDLAIYQTRLERSLEKKVDLINQNASTQPVTNDGKYLPLLANIELPEEVEGAISNGAEGVGLFRSEFLYFRKALPTEEEQFESYRHVLERMHPQPVTIRTIDTGGDKLLKELSLSDESNPFMGWRSIRVCLEHTELFREQLRALLRASIYGRLKIMFPMISSMEELRAAKEILEDVRENLIADGVRVDPDIEIGIMVEVPSAVMMIEDFAKESDFFSIGTNDLVQFTLAVDRSNEKISNLFQPHHPSVLKMIRLVCDAAHEAGITVSVCGEMASDPLSIVLLAGLGVDELSMNPWNIIENKNFLRLVDYSEMRQAALESMRMLTATEINSYLYRRFGKRVMESGASSVMTKGQKYQEKAMIRFGDDFVGISSVEK